MSAATILVVDDSILIRAVLREELERQGYFVVEATDGEVGVKVCAESRPDVVLLDVEMPNVDGYQALAALKADPELRDIPVVFLTTRADTDDVVEGLRQGAHDYLRKPFEANELVARVSAALRTKELQDELRRRNDELDLAMRTDPLTGLYNRRHLAEHLEILWSLARANHRELAVLMCDIDHFKRVNDLEGHAGGDQVLCAIADMLRSNVRDGDVLARWGGEEFLVLLPDTDVAEGALLAERLRAAVAANPVAIEPGRTIDVTVSIGCAAQMDSEPEQVIRSADAALYAAKAAGRDRVVVAPD